MEDFAESCQKSAKVKYIINSDPLKTLNQVTKP